MQSKLIEQQNQMISSIDAITAISTNTLKKTANKAMGDVKGPIDFTIKIFNKVVGAEKLIRATMEMLKTTLGTIESDFKTAFMTALQGFVGCGVDVIFDKEYETLIPIESIDFMGEINRCVTYDNDGTPIYAFPEDSLNKSIAEVIIGRESETTSVIWRNTFDMRKTTIDGVKYIGFKINEQYSNTYIEEDKLELMILNNYIINQIDYIDEETFIKDIMDIIFNNIVSLFSKDEKTQEIRQKVEHLVDKILNADSYETISSEEGFFEFSNEEVKSMMKKTNEEKNNKGFKVNTDRDIYVELKADNETFANFNSKTVEEQVAIVDNVLNDSLNNSLLSDADKENSKNSIIVKIMEEIGFKIAYTVLSPQVTAQVLITHKIINGTDLTKDEILEVMLKMLEPFLILLKDRILKYLLDEIIAALQPILMGYLKNTTNEITTSIARTIDSLLSGVISKMGLI